MRSVLALAAMTGLAAAKPVAVYPRQVINDTGSTLGTGDTWSTLRSNVWKTRTVCRTSTDQT